MLRGCIGARERIHAITSYRLANHSTRILSFLLYVSETRVKQDIHLKSSPWMLLNRTGNTLQCRLLHPKARKQGVEK